MKLNVYEITIQYDFVHSMAIAKPSIRKLIAEDFAVALAYANEEVEKLKNYRDPNNRCGYSDVKIVEIKRIASNCFLIEE